MQSTHAIADFAYQHPDAFQQWKGDSNSIICLSVESEEKLLKLFDRYSQVTPASKFFEPDVDQWTSICLLGTPEVRKKLSHLSLSLKNLQS